MAKKAAPKKDLFAMGEEALPELTTLGAEMLESGTVTPDEVEQAMSAMKTPEGMSIIDELISGGKKDPLAPYSFKSLSADDLPKMPKIGKRDGAKSEVTSKSTQTNTVRKDLLRSPDELLSMSDSLENLPAIQEQKRGLDDMERLLAMDADQRVPGGEWIVKPISALADSLTGSRTMAGLTDYETQGQKNKRILATRDDLQKRRGELSKTILDGFTKLKAGQETNAQTNAQNQTIAMLTGALASKGAGAGNKSVYQEAFDRAAGKGAAEFAALRGYSKVQSNVQQLKEVVNALRNGKGQISGAGVGMLPQALRQASGVLPEGFDISESANVQAKVARVIQQSLRETLGAQFTEMEGVRLLKNAYDPNASEKENADRIEAAINAMLADAESLQRTAEYGDEMGTLKGSIPSRFTPAVTPPTGKVRVKDPSGKIGMIPQSQLSAALQQGYTEVK